MAVPGEPPQGNWQTRDCSVSMLTANIVGLLAGLPFAIPLALAYGERWGSARVTTWMLEAPLSLLFVLGVFLAGVLAHELLHGVTWWLLSGEPRPQVRYGIKLWTFTPYAHVQGTVLAMPYAVGVAMPGIVLGLLPSVAALISGNPALLAFGLAFTIMAGGDVLVLWLIRDIRRGELVRDHPTRVGCLVLTPADQARH